MVEEAKKNETKEAMGIENEEENWNGSPLGACLYTKEVRRAIYKIDTISATDR